MLAAMTALDSLAITVDHRELPSGVSVALRQLGLEVTLVTLAAGDYVVGAQTLIERKTVRDLHASVASTRFWQQLNRLHASATHAIIVIEGRDLDAGQLSRSGVRGVLVALADRGIPVIRANDPEDTALWIRSIAVSRAQRKRVRVAPPYRRPTGTRDGIQVSMLCAIPLVSLASARAVVARFGSILAIAQATPSDLQTVHGVGRRRADAIHAALNQGL